MKFLFRVDSAKNSLVSNFFFSLNLRHIKNKLLFHSIIVQNISVASKTKKKEKREKQKRKKNCSKRRLLDSAAEN